jgi:hypothetical protein
VLASEIVKHYFPHTVNLRNYSFARSFQERMSNWRLFLNFVFLWLNYIFKLQRLLNGKVFTKIGLNVPNNVLTQLSTAKSGIVEVFLYNLRESISTTMLYRNDPLINRFLPLNTLNHHLYPMLPGSVYDPRYMHNSFLPTNSLYKYSNSDYYRKLLLDYHTRLTTKLDTLTASKSPRTGYATTKALPSLISNLAIDNVSIKEVEKINKKILAKDEEIQILHTKLKRLEHLLEIKDAHIQNLTAQVDKLKSKK